MRHEVGGRRPQRQDLPSPNLAAQLASIRSKFEMVAGAKGVTLAQYPLGDRYPCVWNLIQLGHSSPKLSIIVAKKPLSSAGEPCASQCYVATNETVSQRVRTRHDLWLSLSRQGISQEHCAIDVYVCHVSTVLLNWV